ncbi:hypothetical protein Y032_0255g337 [Ancylostoma ceylanicum]|nr:hypothetical protein Y032_0255g337 [Ancylostoma ceylanicum]
MVCCEVNGLHRRRQGMVATSFDIRRHQTTRVAKGPSQISPSDWKLTARLSRMKSKEMGLMPFRPGTRTRLLIMSLPAKAAHLAVSIALHIRERTDPFQQFKFSVQRLRASSFQQFTRSLSLGSAIAPMLTMPCTTGKVNHDSHSCRLGAGVAIVINVSCTPIESYQICQFHQRYEMKKHHSPSCLTMSEAKLITCL